MPVDQQTRRRLGHTGLTALDPEKACPGHLLYAPHHGHGLVLLIDPLGKETHRWQLQYQPGPYGYLLPNGHLFFLARIVDEKIDRFPGWPRFNGGMLLEVDWEGKILWQHRNSDHHHDARRTESGGAVYLTVEKMPPDLAAEVKGGLAGSDLDAMWADVVVEVDWEGQVVWEWHAYEHLDLEEDIISAAEPRHEWSHGNTVVPLPGDRVMVSFRNISTVAIIDKVTGNFTWKLGWDVLARQHDPSLLPNGNVLIFNNGVARKDTVRVYSSVVEIDPTTNKVVWEYVDDPYYNFYSPIISGARRLPNGNTLITEGVFGRMFQVTTEGEVVWEYINPHWDQGPGGLGNEVFRSSWYAPGDIPQLQ